MHDEWNDEIRGFVWKINFIVIALETKKRNEENLQRLKMILIYVTFIECILIVLHYEPFGPFLSSDWLFYRDEDDDNGTGL